LYKFGERYYDPSLGRWTQLDSAGTGYTYANDNPVNEVDPSGKIAANCGTSAVFVSSGMYPGTADVFFTLDSSWGNILFFSVTITLFGSGGSYNVLLDVQAPFTTSHAENLFQNISTGSGFVVAVLSGYVITSQGYCVIYDSGYGYGR